MQPWTTALILASCIYESRSHTNSSKAGVRRRLSITNTQSHCAGCHLVRMEAAFEDHSFLEENDSNIDIASSTLSCITRHRGHKYILDVVQLPKAFLAQAESSIANGSAHVCIPSRYIDWDATTLAVPEQVVLQLDKSAHQAKLRHLQTARQSTQPLLVIRVKGNDGAESPNEGVPLIASTIFTHPNSVVNQYKKASHGHLDLGPAATDADDIDNGVGHITISESFAGANIRTLHNLLVQKAESKYGSSDNYFHTIFCVPNGSLLADQDWTAFTFLFETFSLYQHSRCTRLSTVVHEIGHGMGFRHSGLGSGQDERYADQSGYMGYSYDILGLPLKGFNGHKHWISGWFENGGGKMQLEPDQLPAKIRLNSFVDFDESSPQYPVLFNIGNLFVQYNRAKGYNEGTSAATANTLTITEAADPKAESVHRGALTLADTQRFNGVYFTVCAAGTQGSADFMVFGVSATEDTSVCNLDLFGSGGRSEPPPETPAPTQPPTGSPVVSPTGTPSVSQNSAAGLPNELPPSPPPTLSPTVLNVRGGLIETDTTDAPSAFWSSPPSVGDYVEQASGDSNEVLLESESSASNSCFPKKSTLSMLLLAFFAM